MAFRETTDATITNTAGIDIDVTNPVHVAYAAAGVIGAATVTASVGVVTMAAPVVTLAPIAVAGGLVYAGHRMSNDKSDASDAKSAPKTEPAAA